MRFGENINNVVNLVRGGMNQWRQNLGGFISNIGNRRQASQNALQGPRAQINVNGIGPWGNGPDMPGGPVAQISVRPGQAPVSTRQEDLWARGVNPANWTYGTPQALAGPGGNWYAIRPTERGFEFGNPLEAATWSQYSNPGNTLSQELLDKYRETAGTSLGRWGQMNINPVLDAILAGGGGIDETGRLYSVNPDQMRKLSDWAGKMGLDWTPYQTFWEQEVKNWYGEPTETKAGWTLMGPDKTAEDWAAVPGFTPELGKWLGLAEIPSAEGGMGYTGPDLGVGNLDLDTLLEWVSMGMKTTPLGSGMSPEFMSSLLASLGQGQTIWTGGGDTEDYLANIQPMVSLPMAY